MGLLDELTMGEKIRASLRKKSLLDYATEIKKNFHNNPKNREVMDSVFGMLGIVPGVGDASSAVEAKYRWDQGDKLGAGLAGIGALPLVPSLLAAGGSLGGLGIMHKIAQNIGTPLPAGPARKQAGMFIGKGAKTWDAIKAQQAEEMLKQGIDPREVWKQTGTAKFADNMLRQEIPDNTVTAVSAKTLKRKDHREFIDNDGIPYEYKTNLKDAIKHNKVFSAYPDLEKSRAFVLRVAGGGDADLTRGAFRFDPSLDKNQMSNVGIHEIQHWIQKLENFAKGGYAIPDYRGQVDPFDPNYRNMAGEAEARLTQSRMNLDAAQRLQHYPYDMGQYGLDVPMDQLIVQGWGK